MRRLAVIFVSAVAILRLTAPLGAHHGFESEYDATKHVKFEGVVTMVTWSNPHMRVYIDVTGPDGTVTNWNMEMTSPNTIIRQGWGPNDLKAGERVIFTGFAGKVVESRGSLESIMKKSDMKPLFGPGGPDAAQPVAQ